MIKPKHKPRQIEFIEQRKKSDCGVACLAMLCGYLYLDMASLVLSLGESIRGGMVPDMLVEILEAHNFKCEEVNKLPKNSALVAVAWKEPNISGHYVVWDNKRKQFLDPLHGVINKSDFLKLVIIEGIWKVSKNRGNK